MVSSPGEVLPGRLDQGRRIDRLGREVVAARAQALLAIAFHRVGRECDDRTVVTHAAQPGCGPVAVELGHLHVHEDDVERCPPSRGRQCHFTGDPPVLGDRDLGPGAAQIEREQALAVGRVLGKKDAAAQPLLGSPGRAPGGRPAVCLPGILEHRHAVQRAGLQRQNERAPLALGTPDTDVST